MKSALQPGDVNGWNLTRDSFTASAVRVPVTEFRLCLQVFENIEKDL